METTHSTSKMILAGLLKKETCRLVSANTVPILAPEHLLTLVLHS